MEPSKALPASLYCERLSGAFFAEPLNALSNLAFAAAAIGAFVLWRAQAKRRKKSDWPIAALIAIVALIAIGSFLFHTIPGPVTVLLDVIPIQLFVVGYLALALRRFLVWPAWAVALGLAVLLAVSVLLPRAFPPGVLSGSIAYAPALAALVIIGGLLLLKARREFRTGLSEPPDDLAAAQGDGRTALLLLFGAALFFISLAARTLDRPFCGLMPTGLHFIWHMLNGVLLFLLLFAAIRQRSRA